LFIILFSYISLAHNSVKLVLINYEYDSLVINPNIIFCIRERTLFLNITNSFRLLVALYSCIILYLCTTLQNLIFKNLAKETKLFFKYLYNMDFQY